MNIEIISVGPFAVNCAIVWKSKENAVIIDPGCDADVIERCLVENDLTVAAYLFTHGHADHVSALAELHESRPAPVYMHPADQAWAFGEQNQILPHYDVPEKPVVDFLDPTKELLCYGFQTLETPGHTPGGVCYWLEGADVCFTGDTLFKGSCGRTDLPSGDARTLTASLKKLAETLPPQTRIVAGHGEDSTMSQELATNFYLQRFNA